MVSIHQKFIEPRYIFNIKKLMYALIRIGTTWLNICAFNRAEADIIALIIYKIIS